MTLLQDARGPHQGAQLITGTTLEMFTVRLQSLTGEKNAINCYQLLIRFPFSPPPRTQAQSKPSPASTGN